MVNIDLIKTTWKRSRSLTAVAVAMLALLPLNLAGLMFDDRLITGAPAWLKPAKFAISVAIFAGTILWLLPYLSSFSKQARWASRIIALCFAVEMMVINGQAARGISSHFNVTTPLNRALFLTMGAAIFVLWIASLWLCVLLYLQRFADRALGWALRFGMTISVAGALSGSLMTRIQPVQLEALRNGQNVAAIGGHTVGAPDGGKGLPVTNWSKTHGDLRISHFLGLHGLQVIPLLYVFAIRPRMPESRRTLAVGFVAASFSALIYLTGWQALRGQSIIMPDPTMLTALAIWASFTLLSAAAFTLRTVRLREAQ